MVKTHFFWNVVVVVVVVDFQLKIQVGVTFFRSFVVEMMILFLHLCC